MNMAQTKIIERWRNHNRKIRDQFDQPVPKAFLRWNNSKGESGATVWLYDVIGKDLWGDGISASEVAEQLQGIGEVDQLNVRINSPGGFVTEATAIFNLIDQFDAVKVFDIDGIAASAASWLPMAGDHIRMAFNATLMVHDPWSMVMGDAAELRSEADILDGFRDRILDTFARRNQLDREDVAELMSDESWLSASQALDHGFVDEVTGLNADDEATNRTKHPDDKNGEASANLWRSAQSLLKLAEIST